MSKHVGNGLFQKAGVIPGQSQPQPQLNPQPQPGSGAEPSKDKKNPAEANPPVRLPDKKPFNFEPYIILLFALITGGMVALSAPALIDASGVIGILKVALLAASATLVSYVVNRHAIEYGAEYTALGYISAGIASVTSILCVGAALFVSTYAGLVIDRVRALDEKNHLQALTDYVGAISTQVAKTVQVRPVIDATVADLQAHVQCEAREGCLSKGGRAGRGPITRVLEANAGRAGEISSQLQKGASSGSGQLANLNRLLADFQSVMNNRDLGIVERRQALARIDSLIRQQAGALAEAMPMPLITAYAAELSHGVEIAGQPVATRNVSALLLRNGEAIARVMETIERKPVMAPSFPADPGASATLAYVGHFMPQFLLCAAIELGLPLALWIYVLIGHLWRIHCAMHPQGSPPSSTTAASASSKPASNEERHAGRD